MELVAVQDRPVKSPLDWEAELLDVSPGESLSLTVRDDRGREREITLTVEDLPSVTATPVEVLAGLELITLTPAIRAERSLRSSEGALIVDISDEVTRVTGLAEGDLIVRINRAPVSHVEEVTEALDYLASRRGDVQIYYERNGVLWRTSWFRIAGG
jgi:S1-C subfamily serine protease